MNKKMTFEKGLARINEISELLSGGEVELEQALKLYKEAQETLSRCRDLLADAEVELTELRNSGSEEKE